MSDAISESPGERYVVASKGRSLVVPRAMLVVAAIVLLIMLGAVINGIVQHFTSPVSNQPDPPPPNQIRIGPPAAFTFPQDTTAPSRETQGTVPPPPPPSTVAVAAPKPTAAQVIANSVGAETVPPILMQPDKDWDKIGTTPPGQANQNPANQLTEADRAAVAFGVKPNAPKVTGGKATAIQDRTRTIRPGTRLFCTTQEAIDTTVGAGDFVCNVDRWVQAWDGQTPLIPPDSWVLVHYEELKNGRNKIFAAAGTLTTPDGVIVPLGDPFGMPDGSAGVEGVIQDNTWPRLKEGLILDLAQSVFRTGENLASRSSQGNGNSSFNFNMSTNNTEQAVNQSLEQNRNISDVLRLPEGTHLSMTLLHPVFVQDVVSFTMRAGAR